MGKRLYKTLNSYVVECETEVATKLADYIDAREEFNATKIDYRNNLAYITVYATNWNRCYNQPLLEVLITHIS